MATKEVIAGKIPPQNIDAEKSLLGAVLIDEETLADISEHVTAKDFYEKRHATIYDSMMSLYEKHRPVDLLTLTDELKRKKELDIIGGSAYLTELQIMYQRRHMPRLMPISCSKSSPPTIN